MEQKKCALGCSSTNNLYIFPSSRTDKKRRKIWLDFFDMQEPNTEYIFACERHFSYLQIAGKGLRAKAVPDIPLYDATESTPTLNENWRKNVIVVTPKDPEFAIYRHETGVFPQNLFSASTTVQPTMQVPVIKSVSCSMTTQTNTRLCGSVQISDIMEEYRLNCFYCFATFPLENWCKFIEHLKEQHFEQEEAFKMSKYLSHEHDYTSIGSPLTEPYKPVVTFNMVTNPIIQVPPPPPIAIFKEPISLPPLVSKPQKTASASKFNLNSQPPLKAKPPQPPENKPFNINLADKLIDLLNETILNPNFLQTEEDNILIIKNTGCSDIETSSFLNDIMNCATSKLKMQPKSCKMNESTTTTAATPTSCKYTRPIYTLNYGQQVVPSRRPSFSGKFLPPTLLKNNKLQKIIAKRTLKDINVFEKVYKTVKTRPPKVLGSGVLVLNDVINSNQANERQNLNQTPLSRCLKRTESMATEPNNNNFSIESLKQKPIELVFEFTPEDIIVSLLENIENHPVLWEFHNQPFNKMYNKAIAEICAAINSKWSLNITALKMRRSINRILRFYRLMLPRESIDTFEEYFNKCALFLPDSPHKIPRARCDYCAICYKSDSELRKHLLDKHKSSKWPYKCQQCPERFRERDEYELHKHLPHYEEIYKCEQCHKRFNRRNLYNKHISSHEQTLLRRMERMLNNAENIPKLNHACKVCNKIFSCREYLSRHELTHNRQFNCYLCSKTFSTKTTLTLHLRAHSQTLDYMCEVCGKGFIRKSSLRKHMDTHTGEKVTCNICNLRLRKCSLSRHLRLVHVATEGTIESTFRSRCYHYKKYLNPTTAGPGFKQYQNAPRQYICKICKISFDRLKLLKDHNKQLHADVHRTPCQICNFEFKYIHNLKRHYSQKHNLHKYQVFKLVDKNEDLNTVLAIDEEQLKKMTQAEFVTQLTREQSNVKMKNVSSSNVKNYFEPERMNSNKIQDEIMKAVESIDKQDIKIDDDHSMNEFFIDLLKQ